MARINRTVGKGCAIVATVIVGIPLLIAGVVGVRTWGPLARAGKSLEELDRSLGSGAVYAPAPSGAIAAQRMSVFLDLRATLISACGQYGAVQRGFESVAEIESQETPDSAEVRDVAVGLGGAALAITPFLARFFEARNATLLKESMSLQEYAYIYAVSYHHQLLAGETRKEIFSDGMALSPQASRMLAGCLARQRDALLEAGSGGAVLKAVESELQKMKDDPSRLIWQDGLPGDIQASLEPYQADLDRGFCGPTAGLEMEQDARRAIKVALE